jgi:DNA repair protein RadC
MEGEVFLCKGREAMSSKRYRLKLATWMVVRDADQPLPRVIRNHHDAAALARELVQASDDDREHFWIILLNRRHHYLMHSEISVGSQSEALAHPREIFGPAVREGACALIVVHNHPSSDPSPSAEDRELTKRLGECGKLLGIEVLDHIIVGNGSGRWMSFRDSHML